MTIPKKPGYKDINTVPVLNAAHAAGQLTKEQRDRREFDIAKNDLKPDNSSKLFNLKEVVEEFLEKVEGDLKDAAKLSDPEKREKASDQQALDQQEEQDPTPTVAPRPTPEKAKEGDKQEEKKLDPREKTEGDTHIVAPKPKPVGRVKEGDKRGEETKEQEGQRLTEMAVSGKGNELGSTIAGPTNLGVPLHDTGAIAGKLQGATREDTVASGRGNVGSTITLASQEQVAKGKEGFAQQDDAADDAHNKKQFESNAEANKIRSGNKKENQKEDDEDKAEASTPTPLSTVPR